MFELYFIERGNCFNLKRETRTSPIERNRTFLWKTGASVMPNYCPSCELAVTHRTCGRKN